MCLIFLFCFDTNDRLTPTEIRITYDEIEADLPRSNPEQCIESVNKLYK